MTIDDFISRLSATPRIWTMLNYGAIRTGPTGCDCPITAVAGPLLKTENYRPAFALSTAYRLGLNVNDSYAITNAADCDSIRHRVLRARLLDACGLNVMDAKDSEDDIEHARRLA